MFDDDAARRVLQTLTEDQAPPVTTTLDQVVRRGRRRLFVQRASAVAGVVAVVAGIGVGALLLRPGGSGDGMHVASSPTSAPTSSAARLPGWTPVAVPADSARGADNCLQRYVELPPEPDIQLETQDRVRDAYVQAAQSIIGPVSMAEDGEWLPNSPKHEAPRGYLNLTVPMDNGTGQLMLEAARFGGTPEQVANASITVYGNCGEPFRRTLADGTVLQLYPLDTHDTDAPSQHLQIYLPNGLMYVVTSAGWSETDLSPASPSSPDGAQVLTGGRGKVPVTEQQLVDLGLKLVVNLER